MIVPDSEGSPMNNAFSDYDEWHEILLWKILITAPSNDKDLVDLFFKISSN